METNTQPLYKVLDLARTQGRAMLYKAVLVNNHLQIGVTSTDENGATHTILNATNYSSLDTNLNDEWTKKAEANAKYAAMAMNNFSSVVEALENVLDMVKFVPKECFTEKGKNEFSKCLTNAKQVLNNIK